MKYSLNPFKWILYLWRWAEYRKCWHVAWPSYHRPPKPLTRKGKAALVKRLKAAHEKTVFCRPDLGPDLGEII